MLFLQICGIGYRYIFWHYMRIKELHGPLTKARFKTVRILKDQYRKINPLTVTDDQQKFLSTVPNKFAILVHILYFVYGAIPSIGEQPIVLTNVKSEQKWQTFYISWCIKTMFFSLRVNIQLNASLFCNLNQHY